MSVEKQARRSQSQQQPSVSTNRTTSAFENDLTGTSRSSVVQQPRNGHFQENYYFHVDRQQQQTRASVTATRTPKAWHYQDNRLLRRHVTDKLRKLYPVLESVNLNAATTPSTPNTTATIVQRLEWMLYNAAHSRNEYANDCSLERRVQALVTQQLDTTTSTMMTTTTTTTCSASSTSEKPKWSPKSSADSSATTGQEVVHTKRSRRPSIISMDDPSSSEATGARRTYKRQRQDGAVVVNPQALHSRTTSASSTTTSPHSESSVLFLNNDLNLVAQVFAYLDGEDVLRARSVNQFLAVHAPSMVHSLTLDANKLSMGGFPSHAISGLLLECHHIRRLTVKNSRNASASSVSELPRGYGIPGNSRTPESSVRAFRHQVYGHQILSQITLAINQNACLALESLELRSPFEFATESDTIMECLHALMQRACCLRGRRSPLKHLVLDATFLGDARIQQLAALLDSGACFRDLRTLVLRNNFIGEAGCHSLFQSLHNCPKLRDFDLSGNILTDTDMMAFADALDHAATLGSRIAEESGDGSDSDDAPLVPLSQLQTLRLHENFIGLDGFYALSSAICTRLLDLSDEEMDARGQDKSLIDVSCEKNCAPVTKAMRLFQF